MAKVKMEKKPTSVKAMKKDMKEDKKEMKQLKKGKK